MRLNLPRIYQLAPLILCLFLPLVAGPSQTVAESPTTKGLGESGEGLFERMIIEKITSLESSLKELTQKVEGIEKRLSRLEKGLTERGTRPLTSQGDSTSGPQSTPKKRLKDTVPKEKDIGDGLRVISVDYHGVEQNTFFKGEIENSTTDEIANALFKLEVYGEQGNLMGIEQFELKDLKRAWPKKFTLIIYRVDSDLIADYRITRLR
jgi:hypothetical protein